MLATDGSVSHAKRGMSPRCMKASCRSARIRGAEHLKDLKKKREKSVLYKHKMTDHQNENVKFQMEITQKFKWHDKTC